MFRALYGRITGADKKKQYPAQQAAFLGRVGDFFIAHPYGFFCDLPSDTLLVQLGLKSAISATTKRPGDTEVGEPVVFHPGTNSRIVFRNNGDIDITSSTRVNVDAPEASFTGNVTIDGDLTVVGATTLSDTVTSNGKDISDTHTHDGSPTAAVGPKSPTGVVL